MGQSPCPRIPPPPSKEPDAFPRGRAVRVDGVNAAERRFESVGERRLLVFSAGKLTVRPLKLRNLDADALVASHRGGIAKKKSDRTRAPRPTY